MNLFIGSQLFRLSPLPLMHQAIYKSSVLCALFVLAAPRHSQYFFPYVIAGIHGKWKTFAGINPPISIYTAVIGKFYNVDDQDFRVGVVWAHQMIKRYAIVVDVTKKVFSKKTLYRSGGLILL